jgi:hypothetical protein
VNDLFHMPRISSVPLMFLRGHMESIVDAVVNVSVGIAVSCTKNMGLVHYLHGGGQVAFHFRPFDFNALAACTSQLNGSFSQVCISTQGFLLVLTSYGDTTKNKSHTQQPSTTTTTTTTLDQAIVETQKQLKEQDEKDDEVADEAAVAETAVADEEEEEVTWGSVIDVYNVSGTLVHREYLHEVECSNIQLSEEGDMVILTLVSLGIIRICRLEE